MPSSNQVGNPPSVIVHDRIAHPSNGGHAERPSMLPWGARGTFASPKLQLPAGGLSRPSGVRR